MRRTFSSPVRLDSAIDFLWILAIFLLLLAILIAGSSRIVCSKNRTLKYKIFMLKMTLFSWLVLNNRRIRKCMIGKIEPVSIFSPFLKYHNFMYLKGHKIEIFLVSILKFVLFLYQLCQNIKILPKKIFDQAITGGDTIFPLSLRLSGIEFSLV